jgi:membrane fusion protein (multidrug efflux system)
VVENLVMRRRFIARAALAPVLLVLAAACTEETRSPSPQQAGAPMSGAIPKVEYTVDTSTVELPIESRAQLYAEHDAVVVARTAGTIDSLFAELGDRVRARQPLARMESTEQEIALASAEASLDNVGRALWRVRELRKSGGVTPADSELVEFQLRQAQIARRKAQHEVELTRIVAPFAGVVTARLARPGRFVAVGDTLFRVTEPAPLYARVRVPESSARSLRVGDAASVVAAGGTASAARIVHAAPFVDAASGTRELVLELRSAGSLLAGSSVSVRLGRETGRVMSVPRAAIAPEGYAVVVENGRSTLRPVTLGRDIGNGRVEVLSGLSPGERLARPTR